MEIPVIDYVTNMELPKSFPNTISTNPNTQTHIFFKWGALILALVDSFSTFIKTVKILILNKCLQYSLQQPLVVQEFSDYDSDSGSDSGADSDDNPSTSYSDSSSISDTKEDDRGEGSKDEEFGSFRRRYNGSVLDLAVLFTTGKNVVMLWDNFGLGLGLLATDNSNMLSSLFSPGNVVISREGS